MLNNVLSWHYQILTSDPEEQEGAITEDSMHLQSSSPVPGNTEHRLLRAKDSLYRLYNSQSFFSISLQFLQVWSSIHHLSQVKPIHLTFSRLHKQTLTHTFLHRWYLPLNNSSKGTIHSVILGLGGHSENKGTRDSEGCQKKKEN